MASPAPKVDDADMLAVRPRHEYHLAIRIVAGLIASTIVVLLAAIQGI